MGENNGGSNGPEHGGNNLFDFELPPVTAKTGGFVSDDIEWGSAGEATEPEAPKLSAHQRAFSELDHAEQFRGTLSKGGERYDPAIHKWPAVETPKRGKWSRKTKRDTEREETNGGKRATNALFRKTAESQAHIYAALHTLPFGEDGKLLDPDELRGLIDSLERYYMMHGLKEMSPGAEVFFQMATYSAGVVQRESNWQRFKGWCFGAYNWVAPKLGLKKKKAIVHDIKTGKEIDPPTVDEKARPPHMSQTDVPLDGFSAFYPDGGGPDA